MYFFIRRRLLDYLCLSDFLLQSHSRRTCIHFHSAYYPEREGNKLAITVKKSFKAQSSNFLGELAGFTFNLSREIQLSVITVFHLEKEKMATGSIPMHL